MIYQTSIHRNTIQITLKSIILGSRTTWLNIYVCTQLSFRLITTVSKIYVSTCCTVQTNFKWKCRKLFENARAESFRLIYVDFGPLHFDIDVYITPTNNYQNPLFTTTQHTLGVVILPTAILTDSFRWLILYSTYSTRVIRFEVVFHKKLGDAQMNLCWQFIVYIVQESITACL